MNAPSEIYNIPLCDAKFNRIQNGCFPCSASPSAHVSPLPSKPSSRSETSASRKENEILGHRLTVHSRVAENCVHKLPNRPTADPANMHHISPRVGTIMKYGNCEYDPSKMSRVKRPNVFSKTVFECYESFIAGLVLL